MSYGASSSSEEVIKAFTFTSASARAKLLNRHSVVADDGAGVGVDVIADAIVVGGTSIEDEPA